MIEYHTTNYHFVLYSAANNMDPGPVPPELCLSSVPCKFSAEIINLMISTQCVFIQLTN